MSSEPGSLVTSIASAGHNSSQIPQFIQVSLSTSISPVTKSARLGNSRFTVIASLGQAVSHLSHKIHSSSSNQRIYCMLGMNQGL